MRARLILLTLFVCAPLRAESFGFEITLRSSDTQRPEAHLRQEVLVELWRKAQTPGAPWCPPATCAVKPSIAYRDTLNGPFEMVFTNGLRLEFTRDNSVIEVKLHGAPDLAKLEAFKPTLQRVAFDMGASLQNPLVPHATQGGGHEHLGITETFGANARLFRNFIVYHYNHPEIAVVTRGRVTGQGRTLAALNRHEKGRVAKVIAEFDAAAKTDTPWSVGQLEHALFVALERENPTNEIKLGRWLSRGHTLEIRSGGPFRDADEVVLRAKLRVAILEKMRKLDDMLPLAVPAEAPSFVDAVMLFRANEGETFAPLVHDLGCRLIGTL